MFFLIKRYLKELRSIYIFILGILFPINIYLFRKSLNFTKINLLFKSKLSRNSKFWMSSFILKDKKFTAYRLITKYFFLYKAFLNTSPTSVVLISNNKKKTFNSFEDPKLFQHKNKVLLYMQKKRRKGKNDMEIYIYDINLKKTYQINSPFNFNGKNWIPISGLNSLIFIYCIDPLVILKVVDLNKGKMKTITKIKKGFKPGWNIEDLDKSFVGNKRGGSPMVKVGNNKYLGIGHSPKYWLKAFTHLGTSQSPYVYFFDFRKKIYYTNYLTNNKTSNFYCIGAQLINKNMIRFSFHLTSAFLDSFFSKIIIFDIELDKRELIKIAKRGIKKKIDLMPGNKI